MRFSFFIITIYFICLFRLQLKSVETVFLQWATTEDLRTIHSHHRNDPWKKQVKISSNRLFVCIFSPHCRLTFSSVFRWTRCQEGSITGWNWFCIVYVKSLIDPTKNTPSPQFYNLPLHKTFSLLQLLELSWLPCPNKGIEWNWFSFLH